MSYFEQLKNEITTVKALAKKKDAVGFFGQEVLRFYSIAGTLQNFDGFTLDEKSSIDERHITHILARSLVENYFWILYLFDDLTKTDSRYEELKNSFKREYGKLLNDPILPRKEELERSDASWASLSKGLDVNSMIAQVKNDSDNRLNFLYFIYRIASFDTHGKSLENIFQSVFEKECNFPVLKIKKTFELIANQYLVVLDKLCNNGTA